MNKIIITGYNRDWPEQFNALKSHLLSAVNEADIQIEHVGSTSVPGLNAKPIIDLDIIVSGEEMKGEVIRRLGQLGYRHQGDLGIPGREAFQREDSSVPYGKVATEWPDHHLYVCLQGSQGLENHLRFRDYLRQHPADRDQYGELKERLAKKYPTDIEAYIEGKSEFIGRILSQAGMHNGQIEEIRQQNQAGKEV